MNGNEKNLLFIRRYVLKVSVVFMVVVVIMLAFVFNLNLDGFIILELICGIFMVNQIEGFYFMSGLLQKMNIREVGYEGMLLVVRGKVMVGCDLVVNVLLDFWQVDGDGEYDNEGYCFCGY